MAAAGFDPTGDDLAFFDVYGDWDPLTPAELRELMGCFPDPWWVAGGYAVEAFTGIVRRHEDIDMVVFSESVPALHRCSAGPSTCGATMGVRSGSLTMSTLSHSIR